MYTQPSIYVAYRRQFARGEMEPPLESSTAVFTNSKEPWRGANRKGGTEEGAKAPPPGSTAYAQPRRIRLLSRSSPRRAFAQATCRVTVYRRQIQKSHPCYICLQFDTISLQFFHRARFDTGYKAIKLTTDWAQSEGQPRHTLGHIEYVLKLLPLHEKPSQSLLNLK